MMAPRDEQIYDQHVSRVYIDQVQKCGLLEIVVGDSCTLHTQELQVRQKDIRTAQFRVNVSSRFVLFDVGNRDRLSELVVLPWGPHPYWARHLVVLLQ